MFSQIFSRAALTSVILVAVIPSLTTPCAAIDLCGWLPDQTGCCRRCPACDHVCKLDAEQIEVEKTCFDVESKVICIPRVVFPWQRKHACAGCDACDGRGCRHCVHNGGRTRRVCVLKTDSYTCPACEYTWSAEKRPCGNGCDGACDCTRHFGDDLDTVAVPTSSSRSTVSSIRSESPAYDDPYGPEPHPVVIEGWRAAADEAMLEAPVRGSQR